MDDKIIEVFPLEPLQSAAGWYAGSLCEVRDYETGEVTIEPYDRQSPYMDSKEEAQRYVDVTNPHFVAVGEEMAIAMFPDEEEGED